MPYFMGFHGEKITGTNSPALNNTHTLAKKIAEKLAVDQSQLHSPKLWKL
jgi:hypothetical protein